MHNENSDLATRAEDYLREELRTGRLRQIEFPLLSRIGMQDYQDTVRSVVLNYLTEIGRQISDLTAYSDYPVFPQGKYNARDYRAVKLGSVWFEKNKHQPFLVAEVECYPETLDSSSSLWERIENLVVGYNQLAAQPKLVLLVYWAYFDTILYHEDKIIRMLENGFYLANNSLVAGINPSATKVLVYFCPAHGTKTNLVLNRWVKVK